MRPTVAAVGIVAALGVVGTRASGQADSVSTFPDELPVILLQRAPSFPFGSWQNYKFGPVLVQYTVDTGGVADPHSIEILRTPDSLMANAVRKAIRQSRFRPGWKRGRPAAVEVEQSFLFDDPRGVAVVSDLARPGSAGNESAVRAESVEVPPVWLFKPPLNVPDGMRVRGTLRLRFIVDTAGRVEPSSIRVLNYSSDDRLIAAVVKVLRQARFQPASPRITAVPFIHRFSMTSKREIFW